MYCKMYAVKRIHYEIGIDFFRKASNGSHQTTSIMAPILHMIHLTELISTWLRVSCINSYVYFHFITLMYNIYYGNLTMK